MYSLYTPHRIYFKQQRKQVLALLFFFFNYLAYRVACLPTVFNSQRYCQFAYFKSYQKCWIECLEGKSHSNFMNFLCLFWNIGSHEFDKTLRYIGRLFLKWLTIDSTKNIMLWIAFLLQFTIHSLKGSLISKTPSIPNF